MRFAKNADAWKLCSDFVVFNPGQQQKIFGNLRFVMQEWIDKRAARS